LGRSQTLEPTARSAKLGLVILVVKRHYFLGPRGVLNAAFLLVGLALLIGVWLQVVRTLSAPIRLSPSTVRPTAVAWHHRVYSSEKELKAAFEADGSPYAAWARNHPGALAILRHRHLRSASPHRPTTTVAEDNRAKPRVNATVASHRSQSIAIDVLWVVGLLVFAGALAPARLLARAGLGPLRTEHRIVLAAAATSFTVGLLIASWAN
jgi:hypothetical protein